MKILSNYCIKKSKINFNSICKNIFFYIAKYFKLEKLEQVLKFDTIKIFRKYNIKNLYLNLILISIC